MIIIFAKWNTLAYKITNIMRVEKIEIIRCISLSKFTVYTEIKVLLTMEIVKKRFMKLNVLFEIMIE